MIRTKALRIEQNGRVFYLMSLSAGVLVRNTAVDPWDPSDKDTKGYQRLPSLPRVKLESGSAPSSESH